MCDIERGLELLDCHANDMAYNPPEILSPHQQRLLAIETARVRHAWAKSQIINGATTPALTVYLKASLDELAVLSANDLELGRAGS